MQFMRSCYKKCVQPLRKSLKLELIYYFPVVDFYIIFHFILVPQDENLNEFAPFYFSSVAFNLLECWIIFFLNFIFVTPHNYSHRRTLFFFVVVIIIIVSSYSNLKCASIDIDMNEFANFSLFSVDLENIFWLRRILRSD